jgi:hypothetical protein
MADLTPSQYRDRLLAAQQSKDTFKYPTEQVTIPPAEVAGGTPGRATYNMTINNDADFLAQGMTGSYAYRWSETHTDGSGDAYNADVRTYFPQASNGMDDISVEIFDALTNRSLTSGFVPLETIVSPGAIGNTLEIIVPFNHVLMRNANLRFEFANYAPKGANIGTIDRPLNENTAIVEIVLHGTKVYG